MPAVFAAVCFNYAIANELQLLNVTFPLLSVATILKVINRFVPYRIPLLQLVKEQFMPYRCQDNSASDYLRQRPDAWIPTAVLKILKQ